MEWQPIKTAPKDGRIVFSYWNDTPVLIAYVKMKPTVYRRSTGVWPFRKTEEDVRENDGWRVVSLGRNCDYGIHGNYEPFEPEMWAPIPAHWDADVELEEPA